MSYVTKTHDTFTASNGTGLANRAPSVAGDNWTAFLGSQANNSVVLENARARHNLSATLMTRAGTAPDGADQRVTAVVHMRDPAQVNEWGLVLRGASNGTTGYMLRLGSVAGSTVNTLYILRGTNLLGNSGLTQLGDSYAIPNWTTQGAERTIEFEVTGTGATVNLVARVSGSDVITTSDSSGSRIVDTGHNLLWARSTAGGNRGGDRSVHLQSVLYASASGVPAELPPLSDLQDRFPGLELDTDKWVDLSNDSGTITVDDRLELHSEAEGDWAIAGSVDLRAASGSQVAVDLQQIAEGGAGVITGFMLREDRSHDYRLAFNIYDGTIDAIVTVNGTSTVAATATYDPEAHRYLMIGARGDDAVFWVGRPASDAEPFPLWDVFATATDAGLDIDFSNMDVLLFANGDGDDPAIFGSVNAFGVAAEPSEPGDIILITGGDEMATVIKGGTAAQRTVKFEVRDAVTGAFADISVTGVNALYRPTGETIGSSNADIVKGSGTYGRYEVTFADTELGDYAELEILDITVAGYVVRPVTITVLTWDPSQAPPEEVDVTEGSQGAIAGASAMAVRNELTSERALIDTNLDAPVSEAGGDSAWNEQRIAALEGAVDDTKIAAEATAAIVDTNLDAAVSTRSTLTAVDVRTELTAELALIDTNLDAPVSEAGGGDSVWSEPRAAALESAVEDTRSAAMSVEDRLPAEPAAQDKLDALDARLPNVPAEQAKLDALDARLPANPAAEATVIALGNPVQTNDARLDNLDAPVSEAGGGDSVWSGTQRDQVVDALSELTAPVGGMSRETLDRVTRAFLSGVTTYTPAETGSRWVTFFEGATPIYRIRVSESDGRRLAQEVLI